jgi:CRISPR-associated endonuclease/helicase Cas3
MNPNTRPLLAKSRRPGRDEITLQRHLLETEQAAELIFRLEGRWGQNWCRFFKLNDEPLQRKFLLNLRVAALFHDIGKANEDFYRAVAETRPVTQMLRHEHLSALLLCLPEVRRWLAQNDSLDVDVITAAVLSHHLKASNTGEWKWCQPRRVGKLLRLYLQHPEVTAILQRIRDIAELPEAPSLPAAQWTNGAPWAQAWREGTDAATRFAREIRADNARLALLLAVKAGVIAADAASSGLVREGHQIEKWIEDAVHLNPVGPDDIAAAVFRPRAEQIESKTGMPFRLRAFQERVALQGPRVLLLAACAAGKTLAAWKWAEAQSRERPIGKVIFLYPTRGTATEGFRDYVGWAPEDEGALVHGTSRYELEAMASNPSEATAEKNYDKLVEDQSRLFALGLWPRRYFSATVDQFLGFIEHNYTGLCLLPALADSALIIDEVHSFDLRMFDALIAFLNYFDVPVLCMTATLPPARRRRLEDAGLKVYPTSEDRAVLDDLEKQECHPRYRLEPVSGVDAALRRAANAYRSGERVLWVVNTVNRCQQIANLLKDELKVEVITYHSRFRLQDRKGVHGVTVKAFQQRDRPAIAVTTQVCEMSLDLDADVLISEVAPVPSLVQRFGRANRHAQERLDFRARLHTYDPEGMLPYTKEDLQLAAAFLSDLGAGDVSQRRMAEALEKYSLPERQPDGSARFLEGGYFAVRGNFRDTDEYTQPCVLTSDLEEVKFRLGARRPYDGFIVGVPRKFVLDDARPDWLPRYLGVASGALYCPKRGFLTES